MSETLLYRPDHAVNLRETLAPLGRGPADPTTLWDEHGLWRSFRTPQGPATLRLEDARPAVQVTAWGPGAPWAVAAAPQLLGSRDEPGMLERTPARGGGARGAAGPDLIPRAADRRNDLAGPDAPGYHLVSESAHRHPGLRLMRTGLLLEALIPAILEQRVTSTEAFRSWARLVRAYGEPAPGPRVDGAPRVPERLRVVPAPETWRRIPSWGWHKAGVDPRRSRAVVEACRHAAALERLALLDGADARRRLTSIPGIGVWTAAEAVQRSHGDPDAVSVGDYHLAAHVGTALIGRPVDDARMLRLLS
ncbi:MAG TPA: hypothetical protein VFQ96_02035, partial [Microbacteriaceae bacterium]|nr:hypothetical protein [Microbacteriaceae bacterium]